MERFENNEASFIGAEMSSSQEKALIESIKAENEREMDAIEAQQEQEEKSLEDQLFVIDNAKIKAGPYTGVFKVLSDTPTIQGKLVGTVVEKQIPNFDFQGKVEVLGVLSDWQDVGTAQFQDNYALIKKSKISISVKKPGNNPPETHILEFIDSGQQNVVTEIKTTGMPVPEFYVPFVTHWWTYDYEGKERVENDRNHNYRSNLEKTVYFHVEVVNNVPTGASMNFKLHEENFFKDGMTFNGTQVIKLGKVREVEGKKRITIKLYLDNAWKKELGEDMGWFKNRALELFWKWGYEGRVYTSVRNVLYVYPSENLLRILPAHPQYALPEMYTIAGEIVTFALGEVPEQKLKHFSVIKRRLYTSYSFYELNKVKKEIFEEVIDLDTNRLISSHYQIESIEHFFKIDKNVTQFYVEEKLYKVPDISTRTIVYNSVKRTINFAKKGADIFDKYMIIRDMYDMVPVLMGKNSVSTLSSSTPVSLAAMVAPRLNPLAFGLAMTEWITLNLKAELEADVEQGLWQDWQKAKIKGLQEAKRFSQNNWAKNEKDFQSLEISQPILENLLKGKYKTLKELIDDNREDTKNRKEYNIFAYLMEDPSIKDHLYYVVDSVFIKD